MINSISLGNKIVLSLLATFVAALVALVAVLQNSVVPAFARIEADESDKNIHRTLGALENELTSLKLINREYSEWTITYNYLIEGNDRYIEETFSHQYLDDIDVQLLVLLDKNQVPHYIHIADQENNLLDTKALPEGFPLPQTSASMPFKGVWQGEHGQMLVTSLPVRRDDRSGEAVGNIVAGKYISSDLIARIAEQSAMDISIYPLSVSPEEFGDSLSLEQTSSLSFVSTINAIPEQIHDIHKDNPELAGVSWQNSDEHINTHLLYRDLAGNPAGVLQLRSPRTITQLSSSAFKTVVISMSIAMALILCLSIYQLRRMVSRPIEKINEHLLATHATGNLESPLNLDRNDEIGVLASTYDSFIAELATTQSELKTTRDEALNLAQAKSEFLATMSHEIRTPMNGVLGMADLLARTELNDAQSRYVSNIKSSGDMLLNVINDILDYSKIESGKLELDVVPFNLRDLVEEVGELMSVQAHSKNLDLNIQLPVEFYEWFEGDPNRLGQVLVNLLSNAIKFTEHGEVAVRVSVDDTPNEILVEVLDTGIGISSDQQRRIFESFTQAQGGANRNFGGTGLGLAISTHLVELMEGELGVESRIGKGSRFYFKITLERARAKHQQFFALTSIRGARALVVDDNHTNRLILEQQLKAWGVHCDLADSARQALQLVRERGNNYYQFALLDYHMPSVDGISLASNLREQCGVTFPLVLLTSASLDKEDSKSLAQFERHLTKPVRQSNLYNLLQDLLGDNEVQSSSSDDITPSAHLGAHILVAEDNAVNQEVVKSMLRQLGCTFKVAANGIQATEQAQKSKFDMVFMDCHMPELDGFGATSLIRQAEQESGAQRTPIIALTAHAIAGAEKECLDAGMDDFLSKPFDMSQIQEKIVAWIDKSTFEISSKTVNIRSSLASEESTNMTEVAGPVLDKSVLDQLKALQQPGEPSILAMIAEAFLASAPAEVTQIIQANSDGNPTAMYQAAHSLKSSSASLGALGLSEVARQLEQTGRAEQIDESGEQISALETQFELARSALESLIQTESTPLK